MLIRITAPYFVAGIIPRERAAPIIKYMLYWTPEKIQFYCQQKRWLYEVVE